LVLMSITNAGEADILRIKGIHQKAKDWEDEDFKVKANIGGWDRPPQVEGLIPDLRGERGEEVRIGIVGFEDQMESDLVKWGKFIAYAERNKNVSLRFYSIANDGKCSLYKMIK
jgi:hypothetical protein